MKISPRDITMTGMFAALSAIVAALGRFGVTAIVPFSLQPLVALLAGGILGARLGAFSMLVYVLMGLVGLPVFETVPFGGPAYLLKPTFGFLIGLVGAAYVTGKFLEGKQAAGFWRYYGAMLLGLGVIYLIGLPYLYSVLNLYLGESVSVWGVLKIGFLPFFIFDLLKAAISAAFAKLVYKRISLFTLKR